MLGQLTKEPADKVLMLQLDALDSVVKIVETKPAWKPARELEFRPA